MRWFHRLSEFDCMFGAVQRQGGLYSIQGGCVGFTQVCAGRMHESGLAALARVPRPWAFNAVSRDRPIRRGLTSVDWVIGWAARKLGIPLLNWPKIISEWLPSPDDIEGHYAITPHYKPSPSSHACSPIVRRWWPHMIVPNSKEGIHAVPPDSPLEIEPTR